MEQRDNWYQSNIGEVYKAKRAFAFSIIEQFHLVKVWKPQQWNSLCLVHQTNHYSLHLNKNDILRQLYQNNDNIFSISSAYDLTFGPIFGAIADLQIWKRSLTNQEITDFKECTLNSGGDFYQWNPSDFTLKDLRPGGDKEAQEHPEGVGLVSEERHPVRVLLVSPPVRIL